MHLTLVGHSGREYQRGKVLHSHPTDKDLDIYAAQCENQNFVLKRLAPPRFEQCLKHKLEFPDNHHIRTPVDYNEEEKTVVYEYFKDDLSSLVQNNPGLPLATRKQIIVELGKALQELHARDWIHLDVKPYHVMVDWSSDQQGQVLIERVSLTDLEISLKVSGDELLELPDSQEVGNLTWRSPEALSLFTGQGIGKPSDMFSFGLVCIYTLTSEAIMEITYGTLNHEVETLIWHTVFFGPLCEELLKHTANNAWNNDLRQFSETVAKTDPSLLLSNWQEDQYPNIDAGAKSMLLRLMNLDPAKRATIGQILEDPYWS